MIDEHSILRSYLAANATLTALTSTRIHAALDSPPDGWKPATGACLVFKRRGGRQDESGKVITASFQFKCYGAGGNINQQTLSAESVYRALREALNYTGSYALLGAQEEGRATPLKEPGIEWPYTLAFFRCQLRKTS